MQRFKNILFYVDGQTEPSATLERAVKLAESNRARLTLVDVIEPVETPEEIVERFHVQLGNLLADKRQHTLDRMAAPYQNDETVIYTRVLTGLSFIEVIRFVLTGGFDLVIKLARAPAGIGERLFGSHDLHLLRKCPCPVLIDQPEAVGHYHKVLAAVAGTAQESGSCDKLVMDLSTSLARRESAELDVVHAWQMPGESMFRGGRFRVPEAELENMLDHQRDVHRAKMSNLLEPYSISADDERVHLVKGQAAEAIQQIAGQQSSDIIVMGTVGRVGIPGLFIGNTAEEVLQTTGCSVLAVKPDGFESPVR